MSQYIPHPGYPYRAYLQEKSFVDDIRWEISQTALKAGGSVDALQDQGARVEKAVTRGTAEIQDTVQHEASRTREAFAEGFLVLHFDLQKVSKSLDDMSALFDYGFGQLNTQLGAVNDALDELRRLAKNPEQTWAFEQYEIARDAYRQGFFEEALTYVTRAIEGHQTHTGYILEHRFHYLLGILRLGDFRNNADPVVSPALAEKAFANAARYARLNYPKDAARALCCSGQASYVQEQISAALTYTRDAIGLNPDLPQAHFQLAKFLFHGNQAGQALPPLRRAISLDPLYSVKWADDGDFVAHEAAIVSLVEQMTEELWSSTESMCKEIDARASSFREAIEQCKSALGRLKYHEALSLVPPDTPFSSIEETARGFIRGRTGAQGYLDVERIRKRADILSHGLQQQRGAAAQALRNGISSEPIHGLWPGYRESTIGAVRGLGSVLQFLGVAVGILAVVCMNLNQPYPGVGFFILLPIAAILFFVGAHRRSNWSKYLNEKNEQARQLAESEYKNRRSVVKSELDKLLTFLSSQRA